MEPNAMLPSNPILHGTLVQIILETEVPVTACRFAVGDVISATSFRKSP